MDMPVVGALLVLLLLLPFLGVLLSPPEHRPVGLLYWIALAAQGCGLLWGAVKVRSRVQVQKNIYAPAPPPLAPAVQSGNAPPS